MATVCTRVAPYTIFPGIQYFASISVHLIKQINGYAFNIEIEKYAYLTGRSLSSFKRDFKKIFNAMPERWLTEKRLLLAHRLIADEKKRPSDAYLEACFKNLSHFTYAFRNKFGYSPSQSL